MTKNYFIKNLKPKTQIKTNTTIVISSRRGSGKTTIVKWILYYLHPEIRIGTLISNTSYMKGDFNNIIPPLFIFKEYNEKMVKKFIINQSKYWREKKKVDGIKKKAVLIMDDVLSQSKKWRNDKNLTEIFLEGRHSGITNILSIQDLIGCPSSLRGNIDYLIIPKEIRKSRKKIIFDEFWNGYTDYSTFEKILLKCTDGYSSLFIDIKGSAQPYAKMEDVIFRWKPKDPNFLPSFKIGGEKLWELTDRVYKKNKIKEWEEELSNSNNDILQIHFQD
jgi:energy-coupling factor transporter ATP-binding protein EcfA2